MTGIWKAAIIKKKRGVLAFAEGHFLRKCNAIGKLAYE